MFLSLQDSQFFIVRFVSNRSHPPKQLLMFRFKMKHVSLPIGTMTFLCVICEIWLPLENQLAIVGKFPKASG